MNSKFAKVDFIRCLPMKCNTVDGTCHAAPTCPHKLLEQEDPFESPMLMSVAMCVGCGDCVRACPLNAIEIDRM